MIEHGLISDDPLSMKREIEEFKTKLEGSDVLTYLMRLPAFPRTFTSHGSEEFGETIMGR